MTCWIVQSILLILIWCVPRTKRILENILFQYREEWILVDNTFPTLDKFQSAVTAGIDSTIYVCYTLLLFDSSVSSRCRTLIVPLTLVGNKHIQKNDTLIFLQKKNTCLRHQFQDKNRLCTTVSNVWLFALYDQFVKWNYICLRHQFHEKNRLCTTVSNVWLFALYDQFLKWNYICWHIDNTKEKGFHQLHNST
jgi:hypothetical protein